MGGRETIGAGILPTTPDAFALWIANTEEIKPDSRMPSFGMAPEEDVAAIARYLDSLK